MSYRFMRVLLFFDLPMTTSKQKREYTRFRKYLLKNGFIMMQQSVYSKLVLNATASNAIMRNVRANKPLEGLVQMLTITENQFSKIEFVIGEYISSVVDSDERLIIL